MDLKGSVLWAGEVTEEAGPHVFLFLSLSAQCEHRRLTGVSDALAGLQPLISQGSRETLSWYGADMNSCHTWVPGPYGGRLHTHLLWRRCEGSAGWVGCVLDQAKRKGLGGPSPRSGGSTARMENSQG